VVAEFLRRRVPIHFGGMSDPLQPAEEQHHVTASILRSLAGFQYPTVLSTRSALPGKQPYLGLLLELGNVVVQFSFSTTEDARAIRVEPHATPPSILLKTMECLSRHNVKVTCRWQPYIPGVSEAPEEFVGRVAATGCRHLAFEHLKVPVETSNSLWTSFTEGTQRDFFAEYKLKGAHRDGRELVLPPSEKFARILSVRSFTHKFGMTFGAADNEFQYLSDTGCCCSGVDQFEGFENWFRHQIGHAVRSRMGSQLDYSVLEKEWAPSGSIDRFLNSHSRISGHNQSQGTIRDHVRERWCRPNSPGSPLSFFGVKRKACGQVGNDQCTQYEWDSEALELLKSGSMPDSSSRG
jgi:DNA repair photolyase